MSANALSFSNQKLVADFCDSEFAPRSRGFLVPYAAHVVYIARMSRSTRLTAAFLSEKFGRKFSRRPVEDILAKVKKGDIVVTAEQLAAVASEHPSAQHHAELYPDILNPTSKMEIEDAPTPAAKKAAATKRDAKKSGKAETQAKTTNTLPPRSAPKNSAPAAAPVKPEERSPEKQKQFEALERMKQKLIPP